MCRSADNGLLRPVKNGMPVPGKESKMEINEIADKIVEKEWPMFRTVNGEDHVDCQENRSMFERMRKAQFLAWSESAAESYLQDLKNAEEAGQNLVREKYIRMMKTTDPAGYEAFSSVLPTLSPSQVLLIAEIWDHMLAQTEKMREKYPAVALGGRALRSAEETDCWASIETYQTGELATYSEATLRALLAHIKALEEKGVDLAFEIQKNSIMAMGYNSIDEAEKAISFQYIQSMGGGECKTCGAYEDRV